MSRITEKKEKITAFVVGDPHFKHKSIPQGKEFAKVCLATAKRLKPTFIVILGDVLDTHEIVRIAPMALATSFLEKMAMIAKTFVLVGNHDMVNGSQFLPKEHAFIPLKGKDKNLIIVDQPMIQKIKGLNFVLCPYTPPGRFIDALKTIEFPEGLTLRKCRCVFAHQEFKGCKMGAITSEIGDVWPDNYPLVVSGHIHDAQFVGDNVCYPGSSIQHAFGESHNKRVWIMTFEDDGIEYETIDLGLKGKKIVKFNVEDLSDFDTEQLNSYDIKISLTGTPEQFKQIKKDKFYLSLTKKGVKFSYNPIKVEKEILSDTTKKVVDFEDALHQILNKAPQAVKEAYDSIVMAMDQPNLE